MNKISGSDEREKVTFGRVWEGAEKVETHCVCVRSEGGGDDDVVVREIRHRNGAVSVVAVCEHGSRR